MITLSGVNCIFLSVSLSFYPFFWSHFPTDNINHDHIKRCQLSLSLSIPFSFCLSFLISFSIFVIFSFCLSFCLSFYPYLFLYFCLNFFMFICFSVSLFVRFLKLFSFHFRTTSVLPIFTLQVPSMAFSILLTMLQKC
jgi:hypothetical protein